jgi:hypothetical protein
MEFKRKGENGMKAMNDVCPRCGGRKWKTVKKGKVVMCRNLVNPTIEIITETSFTKLNAAKVAEKQHMPEKLRVEMKMIGRKWFKVEAKFPVQKKEICGYLKQITGGDAICGPGSESSLKSPVSKSVNLLT